jgi:hypothetical protein
MSEQARHPRWADDALSPAIVDSPPAYDITPAGPVRKAALHDRDGLLLGHVWTDDQAAAGYSPAESAGAAGVRAGGYVWTLLTECRKRDVPADQLLDPTMFEPVYRLDA